MPFTIVPVDYETLPTAYQDMFRDGMRRPYEVSRPEVNDCGDLRGGWVEIPGHGKYFVNVEVGGFAVKHVEDQPYVDTDPVIQRYGRYDQSHTFFPEDKRLHHFLQEKIAIPYPNLTGLVEECFRSDIRPYERLLLHSPRRSTEFKGKISLFQTAVNRNNDKRTAMKPGRAIKYMYPELPDSSVETIVDEFRKEFSDKMLHVTMSGSWRDFKRAYSGSQADMENPYTTHSRKSLACSCMRYEFEHLSAHPAEAYASGDFKIIYTHDDDDRIHSRCVVYMKHSSGIPQAGPVYGVCEASLDKIEEELRNIEAVSCNNADWVGARLVNIKHKGLDDQFIAPYLDIEPRILEVYDDDFLQVSYSGKIDASQYTGVLSSDHMQCECCNDSMHEDNSMYSAYDSSYYCEDCFHDRHFFCNYLSEYVSYDEGVPVYVQYAWGIDYETVSEQNRDVNYIYCSDGRYWHEEDATWCEDEQEFISPPDMSQYFISDVDSEVYHTDKMADHDVPMTVDQLKEMEEEEKEECTA